SPCEAIAGLDAEAVRVRPRARPGRPASADDAARRTDVVRPVHARELRWTLLRPGHGGRSADSQPQHSGGVGLVGTAVPEPVSIPAERRRPRNDAGIVLWTGARTRRR